MRIALSPAAASPTAQIPPPNLPCPPQTSLRHQSQSSTKSKSLCLRCIPSSIFLFFREARIIPSVAHTQRTAKQTPPHYCPLDQTTSTFLPMARVLCAEPSNLNDLLVDSRCPKFVNQTRWGRTDPRLGSASARSHSPRPRAVFLAENPVTQ